GLSPPEGASPEPGVPVGTTRTLHPTQNGTGSAPAAVQEEVTSGHDGQEHRRHRPEGAVPVAAAAGLLGGEGLPAAGRRRGGGAGSGLLGGGSGGRGDGCGRGGCSARGGGGRGLGPGDR